LLFSVMTWTTCVKCKRRTDYATSASNSLLHVRTLSTYANHQQQKKNLVQKC
jgi:hypothetical protein